MPHSILLSLHDMARRFGHRAALDGVSFQLKEGESAALTGPNGAGKTTLLRLAAGLLRPTRGHAEVAGMDVRDENARRMLGFLGHEAQLYMDLTAERNLLFFAGLYGIPRDEARRRSAEMIERWGLARCEGQPLRALSRGQRQRAALARAFLHGPRLLLMDEPFTGLDTASCAILEEEMRRFRQGGGALLWASHEHDRVKKLATRTMRLKAGKVVHDGPPEADS